jgi:hypothetical protein
MAWNIRKESKSVKKEILKFPAGLDAQESVVLSASGAPVVDSEVVGYEGQLGYLAGTILKKIDPGVNDKVTQYDGSGEIVGILADNVFFDGETPDYDEPINALVHSCVFNKNAIVDYETYESDLKNDLYTCRFEDVNTAQ